jgi:hypothetical protein
LVRREEEMGKKWRKLGGSLRGSVGEEQTVAYPGILFWGGFNKFS